MEEKRSPFEEAIFRLDINTKTCEMMLQSFTPHTTEKERMELSNFVSRSRLKLLNFKPNGEKEEHRLQEVRASIGDRLTNIKNTLNRLPPPRPPKKVVEQRPAYRPFVSMTVPKEPETPVLKASDLKDALRIQREKTKKAAETVTAEKLAIQKREGTGFTAADFRGDPSIGPSSRFLPGQ